MMTPETLEAVRKAQTIAQRAQQSLKAAERALERSNAILVASQNVRRGGDDGLLSGDRA